MWNLVVTRRCGHISIKTSIKGRMVDDDYEKHKKWLEKVLINNEKALKLLDSIEKIGCKLPDSFFKLQACPPDKNMSGGFLVYTGEKNGKYNPAVVLCTDRKIDRTTFENTVVHELIHAYDQCRIKLDWKNCLHHACTEIRASSLSGECSFYEELSRGKFALSAGHQECVKRRAKLSLKMNPGCSEITEDAVNAAFTSCYKDTAPFHYNNGKIP